ncbi:hypothetical protein JOL62DRAFT_399359 [Phyllosticta paracitricarpa]|uniref:Uncharacterized protein n=1 Tax=Phyllosticta paracitricarpa TaxID=2016321 RepID=A0ABR1MTL8_9PEZI
MMSVALASTFFLRLPTYVHTHIPSPSKTCDIAQLPSRASVSPSILLPAPALPGTPDAAALFPPPPGPLRTLGIASNSVILPVPSIHQAYTQLVSRQTGMDCVVLRRSGRRPPRRSASLLPVAFLAPAGRRRVLWLCA